MNSTAAPAEHKDRPQTDHRAAGADIQPPTGWVPTHADAIQSVADIGHVLEWIEQARMSHDELRLAAQIDPQLAERLRLHSLSFPPEWGQVESAAVFTMFTLQRMLLGYLANPEVH